MLNHLYSTEAIRNLNSLISGLPVPVSAITATTEIDYDATIDKLVDVMLNDPRRVERQRACYIAQHHLMLMGAAA